MIAYPLIAIVPVKKTDHFKSRPIFWTAVALREFHQMSWNFTIMHFMSCTNNSSTLMFVAFMSASRHYFEHIPNIAIFMKHEIHCYFQAKLLNQFDWKLDMMWQITLSFKQKKLSAIGPVGASHNRFCSSFEINFCWNRSPRGRRACQSGNARDFVATWVLGQPDSSSQISLTRAVE